MTELAGELGSTIRAAMCGWAPTARLVIVIVIVIVVVTICWVTVTSAR